MASNLERNDVLFGPHYLSMGVTNAMVAPAEGWELLHQVQHAAFGGRKRQMSQASRVSQVVDIDDVPTQELSHSSRDGVDTDAAGVGVPEERPANHAMAVEMLEHDVESELAASGVLLLVAAPTRGSTFPELRRAAGADIDASIPLLSSRTFSSDIRGPTWLSGAAVGAGADPGAGAGAGAEGGEGGISSAVELLGAPLPPWAPPFAPKDYGKPDPNDPVDAAMLALLVGRPAFKPVRRSHHMAIIKLLGEYAEDGREKVKIFKRPDGAPLETPFPWEEFFADECSADCDPGKFMQHLRPYRKGTGGSGAARQTTVDRLRRGRPTFSDPPLGLSVERYRKDVAGLAAGMRATWS